MGFSGVTKYIKKISDQKKAKKKADSQLIVHQNLEG